VAVLSGRRMASRCSWLPLAWAWSDDGMALSSSALPAAPLSVGSPAMLVSRPAVESVGAPRDEVAAAEED